MSGFFWVLLSSGWTWGQQLSFTDPIYLKATSMVFAGIVLAQMGNLLGCQTNRTSVLEVGIFKNRWIIMGIIFSVAVLLAIIYIPPLQGIFGTTTLGLYEWLYLLTFVPIMFMADELRKYIVRKSL
jgi:magnesium-transporting ATPase (P-type)